MGSAENGGGQHLAPKGRQIGTPPPWDVYDTFPNQELPDLAKNFLVYQRHLGGILLGGSHKPKFSEVIY